MEAHRIRRLKPGRPVSLRLAAGTTLVVARGVGWLTSSKGAVDHLLQPGDEYVTAAFEHIVIEALGGTAVVALRAAPGWQDRWSFPTLETGGWRALQPSGAG